MNTLVSATLERSQSVKSLSVGFLHSFPRAVQKTRRAHLQIRANTFLAGNPNVDLRCERRCCKTSVWGPVEGAGVQVARGEAEPHDRGARRHTTAVPSCTSSLV